MADLIITGGVVVDGTGGPSKRADVAIEGGRIVEIGEPGSIADSAAKRIDVEGRVVAPGFIDIHTHFDAQVFWDPACTPVPFHGVTTVVGGNCGFSIAPLGEGPDDADYMIRMLANVEEIPIASLRAGVPWNWKTTGEYLDRVEEARPAVNIGFMAGHSALRRVVMGEDAVGGESTPDQIERMANLLRASLGAGALGFSTSIGPFHSDGEGNPVPSRSSSEAELVALAAVVGEFPGTELEFIGNRSPEGHVERDAGIMIKMSRAAKRKLNWNVFTPQDTELCRALLGFSDEAAKQGADVYALGFPGLLKSVTSFLRSGLPGWSDYRELSMEERLRLLADPAERARLGVLVAAWKATGQLDGPIDFAAMTLYEGFSEATKVLEGRTIGDIATERRRDPWDVVCDALIADELRTRFFRSLVGNSAQDWEARRAAWSDPRVLLGGSDAGAHVTSLTTWDWATEFLASNREHDGVSLEAAVYRVSGRHAELYGMVGRGRIAEGYQADITVFDPDAVAPGRVHTVNDFPGGASRLTSGAAGISNVFVNGAEIVRDGELTGAQPGRVLRSGHDTVTVPLDH